MWPLQKSRLDELEICNVKFQKQKTRLLIKRKKISWIICAVVGGHAPEKLKSLVDQMRHLQTGALGFCRFRVFVFFHFTFHKLGKTFWHKTLHSVVFLSTQTTECLEKLASCRMIGPHWATDWFSYKPQEMNVFLNGRKQQLHCWKLWQFKQHLAKNTLLSG